MAPGPFSIRQGFSTPNFSHMLYFDPEYKTKTFEQHDYGDDEASLTLAEDGTITKAKVTKRETTKPERLETTPNDIKELQNKLQRGEIDLNEFMLTAGKMASYMPCTCMHC
eukprot:TRINITY_DN17491_c0_g1_i1.p1 TRINITY_DN17491_c0_g1~~TRINITY_DN17491_c0_g1_i1.p1  ORF type:complete len:111 (-),score=25.68 TRINITY_DN17491_c0_g1_i1:207-539(-)